MKVFKFIIILSISNIFYLYSVDQDLRNNDNGFKTPTKQIKNDERITISPIGYTPPKSEEKIVVPENYRKKLSPAAKKVNDKIRIHMIYLKFHKNKKIPPYIGRTGGIGNPNNEHDVKDILQRRHSNHHMKKLGFDQAKLLHATTEKDVTRYLENELIEMLGGAQSEGGTSSNAIKGISTRNKKITKYYTSGRQKIRTPKLKSKYQSSDQRNISSDKKCNKKLFQ